MSNKKKSNSELLYEFNKSEFTKISSSVEIFYSGFINRKKIILLLDFWLFTFRALIQEYGIDGATAYCLDKKTFSTPEFSWIYEFNIDIRSGPQKKYSKYFFYILSLFICRYTAPGAPIKTIFDKIRWRISKLVIFSSPLNYQAQRKADLIEMLLIIIDHDDKDQIKQCLENGLPKVFYCDQNNISAVMKKNIRLDAAPTNLLDFNGIENILLFDTYISLIGRQHGGGFGGYINEHSEKYEIKLSDNFIGW